MLYRWTYLWALFFAISFIAAAPAPDVSPEVSDATALLNSLADSSDTDDLSSAKKSSSTDPEQWCVSTWTPLWDAFDIYGSNWDKDKLGENGAGLKERINKCGAVSDWSFKTKNVKHGYQFHASGATTVFQRLCIGKAVKASGGPRNSCGGSG